MSELDLRSFDPLLLQLAKYELVNNHTPYICLALRTVGIRAPHLQKRCWKLQDWIKDMLDPYDTVEDWLIGYGGLLDFIQTERVLGQRDLDKQMQDKLRDYRIQWLDHLIHLITQGKV